LQNAQVPALKSWLSQVLWLRKASLCAAGVLLVLYSRASFRELDAAHNLLISTNQRLSEQMSRREDAESQLRQAQKLDAIGKLTGGIAHDFNNMPGVIAGSLDLMQRRMERGDFKVDRFMDAAHKATERSVTLTNRLLAFARQQPLVRSRWTPTG
jgi:signal transduction histidine kinase